MQIQSRSTTTLSSASARFTRPSCQKTVKSIVIYIEHKGHRCCCVATGSILNAVFFLRRK
ncbi:hypothetical protein EYF80_037511 [Liparis tanakae]|uniref:Uncharacterized protein n=1 Tax=Liparis tanakae TaxID=230148 RepID=A0A4Z2GHP5_9TELE|nr:hypothetical protein EYF80_037511 [Liparis tanakae]